MSEQRKASPLHGRYLVRNRGWNAALRVTDAALSLLVQRARADSLASPRRILVAVGGHLGDAVIATTVLPEIASAFPNAMIGMLLPSWSRGVVDGHPRLRWLHHADHWKMSRRPETAAAKWRIYRETASRAIDEMRSVGYDIAIDLYAYYPNAAWLLWRAGIPMRVGYASGGCGPLYTTALEWRPELGHTAAQHRALLRAAGVGKTDGDAFYELPPIAPDVRDHAATIVDSGYIIAHPGTGDPRKAWPLEKWSAVIVALVLAGEHVVLTGKGQADQRISDQLAAEHPGVLNLVGKLDWQTFRAVVAGSKLLIGPDSVAVHTAAAAGIPTIAIMAAMSDPEYWRPLGEQGVVLTRAVACAPCFRKEGCAAMSCVRDVAVGDVLAAYERLAGLRLAARDVE